MPLNDKEQEILDEIERQFLKDDPKLARAVLAAEPTQMFRRATQRSVAGFVVGLALMLFFFTTNTVVAMVGFVIMVASAFVFVVALRRRTLGAIPSNLSASSLLDQLRSKWRR